MTNHTQPSQQVPVADETAAAMPIRPTVPDHIINMIREYGDMRSNGDFSSTNKLGEIVNNLRNWAAPDAGLAEDAKRLADLQKDVELYRAYFDLWYFVMDEKPREFSKIVNEFVPAQWMSQAFKLRRAALASQEPQHG